MTLLSIGSSNNLYSASALAHMDPKATVKTPCSPDSGTAKEELLSIEACLPKDLKKHPKKGQKHTVLSSAFK